MNRTIHLLYSKLLIFILIPVLQNNGLNAQDKVACYIHVKETYSYIEGFEESDINVTNETYTWKKHSVGDNLSFPFNGIICSPTLNITVKSSGSDEDNHHCSVFNTERKGSEIYDVNANFYSLPTLITKPTASSSYCVSDESTKSYTFSVNTAHALYTGNWISATYLQIANNASFNGARNVSLPNGTATLSYSDLAGANAGAWYGQNLYYRLRFTMSNGNTLTGNVEGYTAFFPVLTFSGGVQRILPNCAYESPTIKVPVSTYVDYIITIKGTWNGAQGHNYSTADLTETGGYYIIDETTPDVNNNYQNFLFGWQYELNIEQSGYEEGDPGTPCAYETTFDIPEIPDFLISFNSYDFDETDNDGNPVQIGERGSKGKVTFNIVDSKEQIVDVYNGNTLIQSNITIQNRTSRTVEGRSYYSGTVTAEFSAGTYNNVNIQNSFCTSNELSGIILNEPAAISFTAIPNNTISCHTSSIDGIKDNGKIIISDITGGIGEYEISPAASKVGDDYIISGYTYSSSGYDVTVNDEYNNSTPASNIVIPQNSALNFTVINETAPTMSCLSDGSATASEASGGVGGYEYSASQSGTYSSNSTVSGYSSGSYSMYIKDNNGCIVSKPVTIPNAPPSISISAANSTPYKPSCNGYSDGSYTATVSNVLGTLSVTDPSFRIPQEKISIEGDNVITIVDLSASEDPYTIEITDTYNGNSCSISKSFTILEKAQMSFLSDITPVSDKGTATGQAELTLTNENSGIRKYYLYDDNETKLDSVITSSNVALFDTLAGIYENGGLEYYVDVIDENGCSYYEDHSDYFSFKIQEPLEPLQLDVTVTNHVDCSGNKTGTVQLSTSGGWAQLSYEFSDDNTDWTTDNTLNGNTYYAGDQTFYLHDHYGGTASVEVTFAEPAPLHVEFDSKQNVLCNGTNTGWLRYDISGGTYPFSFSGDHTEQLTTSGEDTLLTATQLYDGSYQYTIIDKNGCTVNTIQETITEPEELTIPYTNKVHTSCELDNGELHALADGGTEPYIYTWENLNSGVTFNHSNYTITDTSKITSLPASTYQLEVIDENGCTTSTSSLEVNPYTNPSIYDALVTDAKCYDDLNGEITVLANSGDSAIHHYTSNALNHSYNVTNSTGTFTGLAADTFYLYVYDVQGCRSNNPYPATVSQPDTILYAIIDTIVPVLQKGEATGQIHGTIYGGNDGLKTLSLLDSDNTIIDQKQERNQFSSYFDSLYAGNYNVQVTDAKGCVFTSEIQTVDEPLTALGYNIVEKKDALCKAQTGSFTIEGYGGWGEYSYKRATDNGYYDFNKFEDLYAGNYIVSVQDKLGAVFTDTIVIYEPKDSLQARLSSYSDPSCGANGSLSIKLTGGVAPYNLFFEDSSDTTTVATPQEYTITNRPSGGYMLSILDDNGCRFEMETNLSEENLLTIDHFETTYPSAEGASDGSIEAHVTGGVSPITYSWSELNGSSLTETSSVLSGLSSGFYELTATEKDGCSVTEWTYLPDISIMALELFHIQHETSYLAANGSVQLFSNTDTISNVEVTNPTGTMSSYNASDSTINFYVDNNNIFLKNLPGGNYLVMATHNNGEKAYVEFTIEPYEQFIFDEVQVTNLKQINDSTGTIYVVVSGGAGSNRFDWEYLDGSMTNLDTMNNAYTGALNHAIAGNYRVTATDKYHNSIFKDILIEEPNAPLEISISEYRNESCKDYEDAYVTLHATGGWGDYQFKQDVIEHYSNSDTWQNLDVREHYFYLTDKMGVVDSVSINITEPDYLTANVEFIDSVDCKSASDGNISFNITGGTAPYRFAFEESPGFWVEDTISKNLKEGDYSYIFTDLNNCEGQDTIHTYMPEPDSLLFQHIDVTHSTCNTDNGIIQVEMQGGTLPYRYNWTDFQGNTIGNQNTVSGLDQNALYFLSVADAHDCLQEYQQRINRSTNPIIVDIDTTEVLCYGGNTGSATVVEVTPASPYAPYSFTWANNDTGEYSEGYTAGIHSVMISDTNDCSTVKYFEVTQPDTLQLEVTDFKDAHCFGYNDGFIEVQPSGGVGNYQMNWSNGKTTARIDSLYHGVYSVVLTDSNLCSIQKSYEIIEPDQLLVDLGEDIKICPGNTITIDGQEFTTHQWSHSNGVISNERFLDVDTEGTYYLEVTNEIGCYAYDELSVYIGNDALQAGFLMSSESYLGDTLHIYELSNIEIDSLYWEYNQSVFDNITGESVPEYILQLLSNETGIYNIGLWAYSGGCTSTTIKQVEITEKNDSTDDNSFIGYSDPLITELNVYPNPTDGNFTMSVDLREIADIQISLYCINLGRIVDQRTDYGQDYYDIEYQLNNLMPGAYVIIVTANNERKQVKIIID